MPLVKYRIYELSARAVISYGRQQECAYDFQLSAAETEKCKSLSAPHEQDDNALFYQTMCVLRGDAFTGTPGGQLVTDLSDIIFYMNFSGIFDRSGVRKKHLIRQEKARALFRPEGVSLDFGSGAHRYLPCTSNFNHRIPDSQAPTRASNMLYFCGSHCEFSGAICGSDSSDWPDCQRQLDMPCYWDYADLPSDPVVLWYVFFLIPFP